jgi:dephospho-CoA kinase
MKIAVVGKMRSGKDTLAKFFIDNDDAVKIAFGDEIKALSKHFFPEEVAKGKPRWIYQKVGQDFRAIDPNVWIKQLDTRINQLEFHGLYNIVVSDVRQQNEYDYLKEKGFTVIKVEAADEIRKERIIKAGDTFKPEDFYHETETATDDIPCDYLVTNNVDVFSFYDQIQFIYNELKGEGKS